MKLLITYLKYKKEINQLYGFSLKEGFGDENASWKTRTLFWLRS